MADLPCYHAERYIIYPFRLMHGSEQCIAPRKDGGRCRYPVPSTELDEARELAENAARLCRAPIRSDAIERMTLLRCCGQQHRKKLEDRPTVLRGVAERYERLIPITVEGMPPSPPSTPRTPRFSRATSVASTSSGSSSPYYTLRAVGTPAPTMEGPFEPYQLSLPSTVRELLMSDVPRDTRSKRMPEWGVVYAMVWPQHASFVKIGYSSISAESRLGSWQACHPGMTILHEVNIPFPARMEEIIHAQLYAYRYTVPICQGCIEKKTHNEWFKISKSLAKTTLDQWAGVAQKNQLYGPDRHLANVWRQHLATLEQVDSAEALITAWNTSEGQGQPHVLATVADTLGNVRTDSTRRQEHKELQEIIVETLSGAQSNLITKNNVLNGAGHYKYSAGEAVFIADEVMQSIETDSVSFSEIAMDVQAAEPEDSPARTTDRSAPRINQDHSGGRIDGGLAKSTRQPLKREDSIIATDAMPLPADCAEHAESEDVKDIFLEWLRSLTISVES